MLIDTNVILSSLLEQNDYENSREFLSLLKRKPGRCFITEFSLYSVCIQLTRRGKEKMIPQFIKTLVSTKIIKLLPLNPLELIELISSAHEKLDFDDNVQYYLAKKKNLKLVSYDTDFDKTDLKRLTPEEALSQLF